VFTVPYFTSTGANFLTLMASEGGILKAIFKKNFCGYTPDPRGGREVPHPVPNPSCPLEVMVPRALVPEQE